MEKIKAWVSEHSIAVLVGFTMAILIVSPHLRAFLLVGPDNFEGVHVQMSDDEVTYQARIKEVVDGKFGIGNPYIKERANDPFIMPPVAESAIALFVWITGASVPFITSVSDFVLGFINFILVYILFSVIIGRNSWLPLLYTLLFFFFSLSTFGRPISPQFNALFLFFGLILTAKIYFDSGVVSKKLIASAGAVAGITCFISPYYLTALLAFYVILFAVKSLFEKSAGSLRTYLPYFFLMFLPLAFVYAYFQYKASLDPSYAETVLRYGLMHIHIPGSFTNVIFGVLALCVVALSYPIISQKRFVFALSSIVTIVVLNWQNIITGKSLQFSSHYLFTTILLVFFALALVHVSLVDVTSARISRVRKGIVAVGLLLVITIVGYNQKWEFTNISAMPYSEQDIREEQKKMEVYRWLNENTEVDSVVYTLGGRYDFMLPVYTHNYVFYNFYAALYPAFDIETEHRWLVQNIFDADMGTTTIRERQREYWGNTYMDSYQSRENRKKISAFLTRRPYVYEPNITEAQVEYMYRRWLDISNRTLEENLSPYQIDYFLVSNDYPYFNEAINQLEELDGVSLVATIGGNRVYSFEPFKD